MHALHQRTRVHAHAVHIHATRRSQRDAQMRVESRARLSSCKLHILHPVTVLVVLATCKTVSSGWLPTPVKLWYL